MTEPATTPEAPEVDDPILELALVELLGDERPPDLTERIVAAAGVPVADGYEISVRAVGGGDDSSGSFAAVSAQSAHGSSGATWTGPSWAWFGLSLAMSLAAAMGTYLAFRPETPQPVAHTSPSPPRDASDGPAAEGNRRGLGPSIASDQAADSRQQEQSTSQRQMPASADFPSSEVVATSPDPTHRPLSPAAGYLDNGTSAGSSVDDREVIEHINQHLRWQWSSHGIEPSPPATEGEWCRRVYLDLLGRIPTVEELSAYLDVLPAERRGWLVERLLEHDDYRMELAENWASIWSRWLMGRGTSRDAPGVDRQGLRFWLRQALADNLPYDEFVTELITAEGSGTPGEPDFHGAANFLINHLDDQQIPATNRIAERFLGLRVSCTQCHNHPFNHLKQNTFWELNAFFKQAVLQTVTGPEGHSVARLVDRDFLPDSGALDEAEIYYELRNGLLKAAYPVFVDGTAIDPHGGVDQVRRRQELARLVVGSPRLAEAEVNRLWALMFGQGFTRPVDDLGPHNRPSHPELLSGLAEAFRQSGYDRRRLLRWLVLSDAYALSSRIRSTNQTDAPEAGELPLFSRFYLRQMTPEQLYDSLLTAAGLHEEFAERFEAREAWMQQFVVPFENEERNEATLFSGGISQTLALMNGPLMDRATEVQPGTFLHHVQELPIKPRAKIDLLYLAALSRRPTPPEARLAEQLWTTRRGETVSGLQDIWWALLNSNEFLMNH